MPGVSDQAYLLSSQYRGASNLDARIALHARFSVNSYGWFPWLFDHFEIAKGGCILELGCGTGRLWRENLGRIPPSWRITLSDFSSGMLRGAEQTLRDAARPFSFAVIDAQNIPYADASLDAVIANHMLYHVPDLPAALAEIRRVLRPGGRLYASTIGRAHLQELNDFLPERESDFGADYAFNLRNGYDLLAPLFSAVELHRYDDALVVTEAAPLVAFLLSTRLAAGLDAAAHAALVARMEGELAAHGAIRITKESGLFAAWTEGG